MVETNDVGVRQVRERSQFFEGKLCTPLTQLNPLNCYFFSR